MTACFLVPSIGDAIGNVGAMFWWHHGIVRPERDTTPRPQPHLAVVTPAGIACLDCPASEPDPPGSYWQRSGEPPNVSVAPSLDIGRGSKDHWHGYLTEGTLTP